MHLRTRTVFEKPGIGQRISLHPFYWPYHKDLEDVDYPKRFHPPPGHPRQCQGLIVESMTQCGYWAKPRKSHCKLCEKDRSVTNIYKKRAGATLKALIEEAENGAPEDRLSVVNEIDLARVAASEALAMFSAVLEHPKKLDPATRGQAVQLLTGALKEVANLVKTQSQILSNTEGIMTTEQFLWCLDTMKKVVHEALPDSPVAEKICDRFDLIQPPAKSVAEAAVRIAFS